MSFTKPDVPFPSLAERQLQLHKSVDMTYERSQTLVSHFDGLLNDSLQKESVEVGCLETFVDDLPTSKVTGTYLALAIGEREVTAYRVDLSGGKANITFSCPAEYIAEDGEKVRLFDEALTASMVMQSAVRSVQMVLEQDGSLQNESLDICVASIFPLQMGDRTSAIFLNFHDLCPSLSEDPIEGVDIASLLNLGFEKAGIPAKVTGLLSNAVALLLAGEYERPPRSARCLLAASVDADVDLALVASDTRAYSVHSRVLEVDLSGFQGMICRGADKNFATENLLPRTVVDFEIEFAEYPGGRANFRRIERLVGGRHLAELVRRFIIRTFQSTCPQSVWNLHTLPFESTLSILSKGEFEAITVCKNIWDWELKDDEPKMVLQCVQTMVRRSAAVLACIIAALARRTGRLQPALGGVSVAFRGALGKNPIYQQYLREQLDIIFQKDTKGLITFLTVDYAPAKGAALLCAMNHLFP